MNLQASFDALSRLLDEHESRSGSVTNVEARAETGEADRLHVEMDLSLSLCSATETAPALGLNSATFTEDDGLQVELSSPPVVPSTLDTDARITVVERSACIESGTILVSADFTIEPPALEESEETNSGLTETKQVDGSSGGALTETETSTESSTSRSVADKLASLKASDSNLVAQEDSAKNGNRQEEPPTASEQVDPLQAVRDNSMPPYEDVDYLKELYDCCETFSEMRDEIPMDVSTETVRRYMIDADIHEPTAYETVTEEPRTDTEDSQSDDESVSETATDTAKSASSKDDDPLDQFPNEQLIADGIGLPEEIEIPEIVDAVVGSTTVYEVERKLEIKGERLRGLLKQLNLLDLVLGRISDHPNRETTYEEAVSRVRQCSPTGNSSDGH